MPFTLSQEREIIWSLEIGSIIHMKKSKVRNSVKKGENKTFSELKLKVEDW